jgi:hypothetical protein
LKLILAILLASLSASAQLNTNINITGRLGIGATNVFPMDIGITRTHDRGETGPAMINTAKIDSWPNWTKGSEWWSKNHLDDTQMVLALFDKTNQINREFVWNLNANGGLCYWAMTDGLGVDRRNIVNMRPFSDWWSTTPPFTFGTRQKLVGTNFFELMNGGQDIFNVKPTGAVRGNGYASYATGTVPHGSSGLTNTLTVNLRVIGFTGTSAFQTNFLDRTSIQLGTVTMPTSLLLQPGEAVIGRLCRVQGTKAF